MSSSQQNPPPNPQVAALLRQLRRIAVALENPPEQDEAVTEAQLATATANLDYLAVRQLMMHDPRRSESSVLFLANCDRSGTKPSLLIGDAPENAAKVAVFTGRGAPADVVDLSSHVTTYTSQKTPGTPVAYQLDHVGIDQDITRVEFRGSDDFPLGIAQRLPA